MDRMKKDLETLPYEKRSQESGVFHQRKRNLGYLQIFHYSGNSGSQNLANGQNEFRMRKGFVTTHASRLLCEGVDSKYTTWSRGCINSFSERFQKGSSLGGMRRAVVGEREASMKSKKKHKTFFGLWDSITLDIFGRKKWLGRGGY